MNHYSFDDIEIGTCESFQIEITQEYMESFKNISGDINPMHIDTNYAVERGYAGRIVYGMLASSFYSTLVGVYLPGEKCILNSCKVDYKIPVYVGDVLTVYGEVIDKRIATQRIKVKGKMVNQKGETVNKAEIVVGFTGK